MLLTRKEEGKKKKRVVSNKIIIISSFSAHCMVHHLINCHLQCQERVKGVSSLIIKNILKSLK